MAQYIDKDALLAEIEARYNECLKRAKIVDAEYWNGKADAYRDMLVVLDTLEVKEADLEKEMSEYFVEHSDEFFSDKYKLFAQHFFELGLNAAQKRE